MVKEDGEYLSIEAASILAKTYREDYMRQLDAQYPQYDWKGNKAYHTKTNREAIKIHGATPYHRRTFNLLGDTQLSLEFKEE